MSQTNRMPYQEMHLLPIAGEWRKGSAGNVQKVTDPFTGNTVLEIVQADHEDLNQAYVAAEQAQANWANIGPGQRSSILLRAVQIFDERREEIIDWIIRESGSTRDRKSVV